MGLRELALADTAITLESADGGTAAFTLSNNNGHSWSITGIVGDIGFLVDTDGNAVAGRTVWASFRSDRVTIDGKAREPERGWSFSYTDLTGKKWDLKVLYSEPDRTLGITKIYLVLNLSGS